MGGDGIYCEVMNALIVRTQKDHGVNVHDPDARIVPSTIPVGIIPAGTGDCVAQYLHGTRDVITAALHIVLGNTTPSNAVSVHQGGKLSAYAGLVLGFGLQGDMMYDCEKFRWMGQSRYNGKFWSLYLMFMINIVIHNNEYLRLEKYHKKRSMFSISNIFR